MPAAMMDVTLTLVNLDESVIEHGASSKLLLNPDAGLSAAIHLH
jgi:hypothetical protein